MTRRSESLQSGIRSALFILPLVVACGGHHASRSPPRSEAHPRVAAATSPPPLPRPVTRRAGLRYEIHGRPFPLPIVTGTIAGHPATMLVDTGANSHVVAGWFARKHGLPMKKLGDVGTDHVGKAITAFRVDNPNVVIEEWGALGAKTVLAAEVPLVIEKLGIGAFISPQRLDEEGDAVVLDLAKSEVRAAWWDEAYEDLSSSGTPLVAVEQGRVCEEDDGPVKGLAFVVPANVASHDVKLLVDTGAQHSDVFTSSPAGKKLLGQSKTNKESMFTASGRISARKLSGAKITAGLVAVTTDIDLIGGAADSSCPRDGVLAMDVLRRCALLLGRRRVYGRCTAD